VSRGSTVGAATVLAILWGAPALFAADQLPLAPYYTLGRGDEFGSALAVGDGVVAVGAYLSAAGGGAESGAVYVFSREWSAPAQLCGTPGDWFGFDVAIDATGKQLLVGAPRAHDGSGAQTGAAYLYQLDALHPGQPCGPENRQVLTLAGRAGDEIGSAVALSGTCWAVGARSDSSQAAGAGSVYVNCAPGQPKLYSPAPADGAHFGQSVSLDGCSLTPAGCILAVGAPFAGVGGAAYVFADATGWQPTPLTVAAVPAGAAFGYAVAVSGNQVVVGAPLQGAMAGAAYLYSESNKTWLPTPLNAGSVAGDQFGVAVAFDRSGRGEIIAGARRANGGAGAAYLFGSDGLPSPRGSPMLSPQQSALGAEFGFEVAIDAGTMVVGAFLQDHGAGAAYVFPSAKVTKTTAPGSVAAPNSVLVYSINVTDAFGLGIGGLQLTEVVPDQASFAASSSSTGWSCPPPGSGNLCTLPIGNLSPGGTVTSSFAVTIDASLPAGVTAIANTACARQGPSLVLGCRSISTPTTGAPMLELAEKLQSGSGTPGATLVYQLVVSNTGNQDSVPVRVQETVPANTAWNAAASSPNWKCGGTAAGSSCTQSLGIVPAGSSTATQFAVTLANPLPAGVTSVANTACFAGTQICKMLITPTQGIAALTVRESLSGSATPGATLTYAVTVQNIGNEGASSVVVTDQVPQYTTFQPAGSSPRWPCTPNTSAGSTCTAALGTVAAGATVSLAFAVKVVNPLPAAATTITNAACVGTQGAPGEVGCDAITTPTLGHVNLVLAKQYSGGPAMPSAVLTFTLQLSNTGDQDAGAVTLQETVPAHATFNPGASTPRWSCAATTPGSACTLAVGGLAAGATLYATFAVTADACLPPATVIDNQACATTGAGAPVCANAGTPPPPPPQPLHFYTLTPCRALDTRLTGVNLTESNRPQVYQLSGVCHVPASAVAVAVNVTLVGATTALKVQGYPGDLAPPCIADTVIAPVGGTIAGFAVLRLATSGAGTLAFLMTITPPADEGQTDLLLDLSGYFAPP
jgi:uncharacterized repeat protein (TIGR01451 family)